VDRDIGIYEVSYALIARRQFDRLATLDWRLGKQAERCDSVSQADADGEYRDHVANPADLQRRLYIVIGDLGGNANGLTVSGPE